MGQHILSMAWTVDPAIDYLSSKIIWVGCVGYIFSEASYLKWDLLHPAVKALVAKGHFLGSHVDGMLHGNIVQSCIPFQHWLFLLFLAKFIGEIQALQADLLTEAITSLARLHTRPLHGICLGTQFPVCVLFRPLCQISDGDDLSSILIQHFRPLLSPVEVELAFLSLQVVVYISLLLLFSY